EAASCASLPAIALSTHVPPAASYWSAKTLAAAASPPEVQRCMTSAVRSAPRTEVESIKTASMALTTCRPPIEKSSLLPQWSIHCGRTRLAGRNLDVKFVVDSPRRLSAAATKLEVDFAHPALRLRFCERPLSKVAPELGISGTAL